jgi:hypothetical protein
VNAANFNELSETEKQYFYQCPCGEMVDKRQLDDVLFHEDHVQRQDIQYGGSQPLGEDLSRLSLRIKTLAQTCNRRDGD